MNKIHFPISFSNRQDQLFIPIVCTFSLILLGLVISLNSNFLIYIVVSIVIITCLFNFNFAYFLFISLIPIEYLLKETYSPAIKGMGLLILFSFLLSKRKRFLHYDRSLIYMVLFLVWSLLSLIWSNDIQRASEYILTYSSLTVFYLLIINQNENKYTILKLTFSGLFTGGLGLIISGYYQIITETYRIPDINRISGATNDQNYYFILCICILPAFYWMYKQSRKKIYKFLISTIGVSLIISALYTKSRAGLISLCVFFILIFLFNKQKKSLILVVPFLALLFLLFLPQDFLERFRNIQSDDLNRITLIWPSVIRNILGSPLLGYGIGNGSIQLLRTTSIPYYYNFNSLNAHCLFLGIWLDVGIIGLVPFLLFILSPIYKFIQIRKQILFSEYSSVLYLVLSSYFSFLAFSLVSGGLETRKILWIQVGLLSIIINVITSCSSNRKETSP